MSSRPCAKKICGLHWCHGAGQEQTAATQIARALTASEHARARTHVEEGMSERAKHNRASIRQSCFCAPSPLLGLRPL